MINKRNKFFYRCPPLSSPEILLISKLRCGIPFFTHLPCDISPTYRRYGRRGPDSYRTMSNKTDAAVRFISRWPCLYGRRYTRKRGRVSLAIDDEVDCNASIDYVWRIPSCEEIDRPVVQLTSTNNLEVCPLISFRDFDNGRAIILSIRT